MNILLFILYYSTLVFVITSYIHLRRKGRLTISDGIITVTSVVILMGGYFNSYGFRYGLNELNVRVFLDYYIFMWVMPLGLIIGSRIKIKNSLGQSLNFKPNRYKLKLLLIFIISYGALYIYFIKDSVPLLMLLSGRVSNVAELTISRISITHDYEASYNIPFVLRYYRLVINDLTRFLLALVFLLYLSDKNKFKKIFYLTFVTAFFFHVYSFEKSGLIYLSLTIFLSYISYKGISFNRNRKAYSKMIFIGLFLMISMYMIFMGANDPLEATSRMIDRAVIGQTSGIYYQDIILESNYNSNLWGKGVPFFLLDSVLGRNTVDLSGEAYGILYSQYAVRGVSGTTGGMPMFFLRSNFGYLIGTATLFSLSFITGAIDNALTRALQQNENKIVVSALYAVMVIYFIQAFMSNFTRVFMLPFLLSPQLIIIVLAIIFLKLGRRGESIVKRRLYNAE